MEMVAALPEVQALFQRSLTAHLPPNHFSKLQHSKVLIAGLGGGSNIAELLARKGIGQIILADPDVFECHNIRQRGCSTSTWGKSKVEVMQERLLDINPHMEITPVPEGITLENVELLAQKADWIVDMIDLHGVQEKIALYKMARKYKKFVLTAPSVINGAVLWIFPPDGISYERFCGFREGMRLSQLAWQILKRFVGHFPIEAPESMYREAAAGKRTIPLDGAGVDQAAVMTVAAIENLILGRWNRLLFAPRGLQIDASDPFHPVQIIDRSKAFL